MFTLDPHTAQSIYALFGYLLPFPSHSPHFTPLLTSFFSKKTYQIIHFLYHIIYYSNKKIITKQNFSLSNTIFSFFISIIIYFLFFKKMVNSTATILWLQCLVKACSLPNTPLGFGVKYKHKLLQGIKCKYWSFLPMSDTLWG
jgi:hypothetical protein